MKTGQNQKISAVIITYNEIGYIERCISSVSFANEIIVVDSYSSDGTYEYLSKHPKVKVFQHPFQDFTKQKTYAMRQASHDWVLFLDADEVVSPNLGLEIKQTVQNPTPHVAFWFYRKFMFENSYLRFSGWQTDKNYRLFRKSKVRFCQDRRVHECLEVEGSSGILKERLIHRSFKDYGNYKAKMLHYGKLKALQDYEKEKSANFFKLMAAPFWKFFYNYTVRLGILDGKKGLIICYLNALSDFERYRHYRLLNGRQEPLRESTLSPATD